VSSTNNKELFARNLLPIARLLVFRVVTPFSLVGRCKKNTVRLSSGLKCFGLEGGGSVFFRNVCCIRLQDYTVSQLRPQSEYSAAWKLEH
jgi:hypothetical protein